MLDTSSGSALRRALQAAGRKGIKPYSLREVQQDWLPAGRSGFIQECSIDKERVLCRQSSVRRMYVPKAMQGRLHMKPRTAKRGTSAVTTENALRPSVGYKYVRVQRARLPIFFAIGLAA